MGWESKENSDFEAKIRDVNSVSGEKLHDFEIICPARGVRSQPPHPLRTGLHLYFTEKSYFIFLSINIL